MSELNNLEKFIFIYYVIINLSTFIVLGVDKFKAKKKRWRIKESTIFILGLVGGGAFGLLGMKFFHHKTKKPIFYVVFIGSILIHLGLWFLYNFIGA